MIRNLRMNKTLWLTTALLSFATALAGVIHPDLYVKVVSKEIMPAVMGQDLMTVATSLLMLIIGITIKEKDYRKQVLILGILGYLFYAYGIYVIERLYTVLYYPYLAIWGLSFWSLIYGLAKFDGTTVRRLTMPDWLRNVSAGFSLLVALIFTVLWVLALLPLIEAGEKIEFFYSVYILDLCFIMPVFAIAAIMAFKKICFSLVVLPAMYILGFALMLSLVVSEAIKSLYGVDLSTGDMLQSLVLSLVFLILAVSNLLTLAKK